MWKQRRRGRLNRGGVERETKVGKEGGEIEREREIDRIRKRLRQRMPERNDCKRKKIKKIKILTESEKTT